MASTLVRSQPSLHHALSLDHIHPTSHSGDHNPPTFPAARTYRSDQQGHTLDRKMSITSYAPPRSRPSLTSMITSSKLLRRLAPSSPSPTSPPAQSSSKSTPLPSRGSTHARIPCLDVIDLKKPRRPIPSRSSTLPSLPSTGSAWELLVVPEEPDVWSDQGIVKSSISPHSASDSLLPRRIPSGRSSTGTSRYQKPSPPSPLDTTLLVPTASAPNTPCRGIWLCSPPTPVASPTLSEIRCQRRPPITTRALSTARIGNGDDESNVVGNVSSHSDRVLAKGAGASGKEEGTRGANSARNPTARQAGLARSQSAAVLGTNRAALASRPGNPRADTTAAAPFVLEKSGWGRESGSSEPLLDGDMVVNCVGRRKTRGLLGL